MMPIDEHAQSGGELVLIHVAQIGITAIWLGSWGDDGFYSKDGGKIFPTHYLPASWVEQAGAMRHALGGLVDDEPCHHDHHGYCQSHYLSDPCEMDTARAVLTATQWPPKDTADG